MGRRRPAVVLRCEPRWRRASKEDGGE